MNEEKRCTFKDFFAAHAPLLVPHRGKLLGVLVGLFLGTAVLLFGFWQTLFVLFCAFIGLAVGIRIDHGINFRDVEDFLKDVFPYRYRNHRFK